MINRLFRKSKSICIEFHFVVVMFVACSFAVPVGASAQQSGQPSTAVEQKDPALARSYAFYLPGGGYAYTGEYARAGIALGASVLGLYKLVDELGCQVASNTFLGADMGCSASKKWLWFGVMIAPYIYGIVDAPNSAARVNGRNSAKRTALFFNAAPRVGARFGLRTLFR